MPAEGKEEKEEEEHFHVSDENVPKNISPVSGERVNYYVCFDMFDLRNTSQHPEQ